MSENSFDDIEKITSIVCYPTPSLVVKHVISLKRKIPPKFPGQKELKRGYVFNYTFNEVSGMYLECKGEILLEGHRSVINKDGGNTMNKVFCYIEMKDISNFLNRLEIVYTWLTGEMNKQIYVSDSQGRPCRIADPNKRIIVTLKQSTYLSLSPCIIKDISDMTYEGISMSTERGEVTNFTAAEFASFNIIMHGLLPNLYMANSVLINNALQICTYNKMLDIESHFKGGN
jgi:hypothetical protein